jgi:signal peptidase I
VTDEIAATTADPSPGSTPPVAPASPNGAAPGSTETTERKRRINRTVIEWGALLLAAVVLALGIKTFLFQAFYIPSGSMIPTLEIGDRVLVNKLSYDLHDVNRGDIVVFEADPNPGWRDTGNEDLVKRVIALPGETVDACGDESASPTQVCIDGRELKESYLPEGTTTDMHQIELGEGKAKYGCAATSPVNGCTVLPGHVFVMGDNREQSSDARVHGAIKESSIVGRVFVRIWPLDRIGFL